MRVLVPLSRRRITGIVTATVSEPPAGMECREVLELLDLETVLPSGLLTLSAWMADYYGVSISEVLSLSIGRGLTAATKRQVILLDSAGARSDLERRIVEVLESAGGKLDTVRLGRRLMPQSLHAPLRALVARSVVRIEEGLAAPKVQSRYETFVELVSIDETSTRALLSRAPKRQQIVDELATRPQRRASIKDLGTLFGSCHEQVRALEQAGLVRRTRTEVCRGLGGPIPSTSRVELSQPQREALESIAAALGRFEPLLLQGVTASGKTEVYLHAIERALGGGGSALVLVPEISLTHQLVEQLLGRFGATVAVLHSELNAGERWDQWRRICRREARIVVGARSAVLAPLHDLRLVVVDEEHDPAYKQDDGVRYHGRDVAIVRAQQAGCPVVLGSATPSIETRLRAREGRYQRLILAERVTASPLPSVEVVDIRGRDIIATGGLSRHLAELMRRNHAEGGQTLLFLNRRGYAANLQCYACGEIVRCTQCSVGMTLHGDRGRLRCHHCDAGRSLPQHCPACGGDALLRQGLGTQRLEATVTQLLPEARVARLDRDVAQRKGASRSVLEAWRAGSIDVLVGTQMIAKGHDAPGVTLVGVVQADLALGMPDFRAAERTFQLLAQVAGRAGRGTRRGRVILQTYQPEHFAVRTAAHHDYEAFAERELVERGELGYPPFTRMALLRVEGASRDAVVDLARAAGEALRGLAGKLDGDGGRDIVVRGPAAAPIERIKGRFRYQVQVRSAQSSLVRHAAIECRRLFAAAARRRGVRLILDIDPVDML
jgi:primosomal protein N' (replication factor Y)